jgi:Ca-activated chloride channel family protein
MFFEYPKLLWLMVVPALLVLHYIYLELAERHPHLRVSTAVPWLAKSTRFKGALRHIPFILRTVALCLIVVAIARPRSSEDMEKIDTEGIDIVLAMDVSTSMLARDLTPDRINASKDIAIEFISQRPSDRMGIVVFAGESFTQCPLTTDRATLINLMKEVQTDLIEDGTAIGNGLATAIARMKDSDAKSRVVILLTDGVNNR